jgi:hypothetical protein
MTLPKLTAMALLIVAGASLSSAAMADEPSRLTVVKDWIFGCDNGLNCHAASLSPEGGPRFAVRISIKRNAHFAARPVLDLHFPEVAERLDARQIAILVDGKAVTPLFTAKDLPALLAGDVGQSLLARLAPGEVLELHEAGGNVVGAASLKGLRDALASMDAQQNRNGTVTAIINVGQRPAESVPRPPLPPIVRVMPQSTNAPRALDEAAIRAQQQAFRCRQIEPHMLRQQIVYARVDHRTTLALIPPLCGMGAYNSYKLAVLIDENGKVRAADFEKPRNRDRPNMLVNTWWDKDARMIGSHGKARGLGDCGVSQRYQWDGIRFRLVEQMEMSVCRGSTDFITTWRATIDL